ncbi:hypothetical protein [Nocardiopsis sp. HUAS JQ3]|uniref:hypothetical protein n=1 Tax=Nocardiopsis sp. HUAS JQ3 TaxID=3061629 RepID=UPI0023A9277C|nr:hypothetical protein [Nocardiopsis sp. HUAS JQ3]WDZ91136.1 hypothetical protein PV789_00740 [Nocardiopsis sp. HUAS JQ3]
MPRPAYPPDWSTTVRGLQAGVRAAYTAAQTRVRYAAIRTASIIIGPQVGAQITIDPGDDSAGVLPHVRIASAGGDGFLVGQADSVGLGSALRTTDDHEFGGISVGGGAESAYVRAIVTEGGAGRARMELRADGAHLYAIGEAEIRSGYAGGSSPYGVARTDTDGAVLACYSATGAALATVRARADGTVAVYQSAAAAAASSSAPTTFARTAETTVADPGPDADPADQTAFLRDVVERQAAELAELRDRLDRMPRFEVATADDADWAEEGER